MSHTIAVIIPAYNAARLITEALDNLLLQTRRPDQIIVVDDGSTDSTVECVNEWKTRTRYPLELISQPNRGVAAARNKALRHARTDLIAFLDADDLFHSNHLETLARSFLHDSSLVLAFGIARVADENDQEITRFPDSRVNNVALDKEIYGVRLLGSSLYESLIAGSYIAVSATLFSKAASDQIGHMDEAFTHGEDLEFWLRLSRVGRFAFVPAIIATKRVHSDNATHPRKAFQMNLSTFRMRHKLIMQAGVMGLNEREIETTWQVIKEQVPDLLYSASRKGFAAYAQTWLTIARCKAAAFALNPRHLVRACYVALGGRLSEAGR
jgi:glycosyltransferase involved in cell wall biosynthesis